MEIFGDIDFPLDDQTLNQDAVIVQGWCFSEPQSELCIEISIDDKVVDVARWGLARFDVYQKYGTENSYESGFASRVPLLTLGDGNHQLKVIAKTNNEIRVLKEITIHKKYQFGLEPIYPVATGSLNFRDSGMNQLKTFIDHCNLKPEHTVLDIGCGMGRMAMPLTRFLDKNGQYHGLDTIEFAIDYCKKNISSRYPNFLFQNIDVYNKIYNLKSKSKAKNYSFPYEDNKFDFVFLISVFTHMLPNDLDHYLGEINRILKKGGICFATFFIYNKQRLSDDQDFNSNFRFAGNRLRNVYRLRNKQVPEVAIAYDEKYLQKLYPAKGFQILELIRFDEHMSQDSIIAQK